MPRDGRVFSFFSWFRKESMRYETMNPTIDQEIKRGNIREINKYERMFQRKNKGKDESNTSLKLSLKNIDINCVIARWCVRFSKLFQNLTYCKNSNLKTRHKTYNLSRATWKTIVLKGAENFNKRSFFITSLKFQVKIIIGQGLWIILPLTNNYHTWFNLLCSSNSPPVVRMLNRTITTKTLVEERKIKCNKTFIKETLAKNICQIFALSGRYKQIRKLCTLPP